jgi:hypothetical protein
MSVNYEVILYLIFKILIVLVAALCFYLGYKLFLKGIIDSAGNLEASNRIGKMRLFKAAPGTFLFVIGGFIICYMLTKSNIQTEKTIPYQTTGVFSNDDSIPKQTAETVGVNTKNVNPLFEETKVNAKSGRPIKDTVIIHEYITRTSVDTVSAEERPAKKPISRESHYEEKESINATKRGKH